MTHGGAEDSSPAVHERPWAVGVYLAFAALVGLAWAAPLAAIVGGVTGKYPRGDREVFDPGGVMLVEAARRLREQLAALQTAWSVIALLALPVGVVVLAFAIALLATPGPARPARLVWAFARAVRSFPALAVIGLVALLADAAAFALVMIGGGAFVRASWPEPPARDIARFALFGCALLPVVAIGVLHDLARAAAVMGPARTYVSLRAALRAVRRNPGHIAWAYTWRAALGLAAIVAAAWLGIQIGHGGTVALAASAFAHQLGLALMGWMRLSWLSRAVKVVRVELQSPARTERARDASDPGANGNGATEARADEGAAAAIERPGNEPLA